MAKKSGKTHTATKVLTSKEKEILIFTIDGLKQYEIAQKLNITLDCVEYYMARIYLKTGTNKNICRLVVWAIENKVYSIKTEDIPAQNADVLQIQILRKALNKEL